MADSKISALTSATTPLAGTEVLPIVQSGATVKVAVSDLTTGRSVSASDVVVSNSTVNAVAYFNASKRLASGSTLTFAGGTLSNDAAPDGTNAITATGTTVGGFIGLRPDGTNGSAIRLGGAGALSGTLRLLLAGDVEQLRFSDGNLVPAIAAKGINFTANTPAAGMTSQLLNWYEEGTWTPANDSMTVDSGSWAATGTYTRVGRTVFYNVVQTSGTVSASSGVGMISGFPYAPASPVSCTYTNSSGTLAGVGLLETNSKFYGAVTFASQTTLRFSGTYQT